MLTAKRISSRWYNQLQNTNYSVTIFNATFLLISSICIIFQILNSTANVTLSLSILLLLCLDKYVSLWLMSAGYYQDHTDYNNVLL